MSDDLRTRMHHVADEVTPLPVSADLWRRGRAARRRAQALAVAAVLVFLASVGGGVALWSAPDREARTASGEVPAGGAIPSRIEDIPEDLEVTTDLAVGRASVAFISATGDPVVITANDGVPRRLGLPGWALERRTLALSPDGRFLAYQRVDAGTTVISRLDLETGREEVLHRQPGEELTYDTLTWSPGGEWLAWSSSRYGDVPAVGRIRPGESRTTALPFTPSSVAVTDSGALALTSMRGGLFLPVDGQRGLGRVTTDVSVGAFAFSPDGHYLSLGTEPGTSSSTFDVRTQEVLRHPFPPGTLGRSAARPVGWLDDRLQVLVVQPFDGSVPELVVTTPDVGAASTWRGSVGSVSTNGIANSLSLAVDLIPDLDGTSSQELTHDFGDTAGTPRDVSWIIGLGVAAAIALLLGLRLLWRRLT
ncbi:WD40 repeat domain-containing protein [Nocardioides lacusdianchii]|uniref:WD40 repeat domain-containing protein n=1 Tax=Nocardioides lacusdianchii TaxID=2783664 RepID=UPI001CC90E8C|nr:WD40 repeat domain-containing protein [Nocardioides lacusdianchii]